MRPIVLGLTGANAAGKGAVAEHLVALGYRFLSLSDIVRERADREGVPPTRSQLIRLGQAIRQEGGAGALAQAILPRLGTRDVVDSIRHPDEVRTLRRLPGFHLIGVHAPARLRFERSRRRARPGDPEDFETFLERERQENSDDPRAQQLDATFALADTVVENDGDLERLREAVGGLVARLESQSAG